MKIKSQKDFFAGLMFMCVGVAFAWGATTYNVGTGARMGPGYFPLMLGILLALIGSGLEAAVLHSGRQLHLWHPFGRLAQLWYSCHGPDCWHLCADLRCQPGGQ